MVESFENVDNILHDWTKDKLQKSLVEALNRYEKQEEQRKIENDLEKIPEQSQSVVEQN